MATHHHQSYFHLPRILFLAIKCQTSKTPDQSQSCIIRSTSSSFRLLYARAAGINQKWHHPWGNGRHAVCQNRLQRITRSTNCGPCVILLGDIGSKSTDCNIMNSQVWSAPYANIKSCHKERSTMLWWYHVSTSLHRIVECELLNWF